MPSKYPILPPRDILKALEKVGFHYISQKGSHIKYSDGKHIVIIPNHSEVARGTLHSILQQAGLDIDSFLELL